MVNGPWLVEDLILERRDLLPDIVLILACSRLGDHDLLPAVGVWRRPRRRQGQALAGGLRPALTPAPGDTDKGSCREQIRGCKNRDPGECLWRVCGVGWAVRWQFSAVIFLIWLGK
jgi:hypothetical protein